MEKRFSPVLFAALSVGIAVLYIPMIVLIAYSFNGSPLVGVWGGAGRLRATLLFVIYTMAGSLLMLASIIVLGLSQGTFDLVHSGTNGSDWTSRYCVTPPRTNSRNREWP